jgi:hypothetical protein
MSICHSAKDLIVVPPGSTLLRGDEVDLTDSDPGSVTIKVKIRLLEVPSHLGCEPARLFSGETAQVIDIIGGDKRSPLRAPEHLQR